MKNFVLFMMAMAAVAVGPNLPAAGEEPLQPAGQNAAGELSFDRILSMVDNPEAHNLNVAALLEMVNNHPEDFAARLVLADGLLATGAPDTAEEHLRYVLDRCGEIPRALDLLALCYMKQHRVRETVQTLDKRIEIRRRSDTDLSATLRYYQQAARRAETLELSPDAPETAAEDRTTRAAFNRIAAAAVDLARDQFFDAQNELEYAYTSLHDAPLIPYMQAEIALKTKDSTKLEEAANRLQERIGNWEDTFIARYTTFFPGQPTTDEQQRRKAVRMKIGVSKKSTLLRDLYTELTTVRMRLDDYAQAKESAAAALQLSPRDLPAVQQMLAIRRHDAEQIMAKVPQDLKDLQDDLSQIDENYLRSGRIKYNNDRGRNLAEQQRLIARQEIPYLIGQPHEFDFRQEVISFLTRKIDYELPLERELVYGPDDQLDAADSEDGLYPPSIDARRNALLHRFDLSFTECERLLVLINLQVEGFHSVASADNGNLVLDLTAQNGNILNNVQKTIWDADAELAAGADVLRMALLDSSSPELRQTAREFYRYYAGIWQKSVDMSAAVLQVFYPPAATGQPTYPEQLRHVMLHFRQYRSDLAFQLEALDALCTVNETALHANDLLTGLKKLWDGQPAVREAQIAGLAELVQLAPRLEFDQFRPFAENDYRLDDPALPYREFAPESIRTTLADPSKSLSDREKLVLLLIKLKKVNQKQLADALQPETARTLSKNLNALAETVGTLRSNLLDMDEQFEKLRFHKAYDRQSALVQAASYMSVGLNVGENVTPLDPQDVFAAGALKLEDQQKLRDKKRRRYQLLSRQLHKFDKGLAASANVEVGAELPPLLSTDQPQWLLDLLTKIGNKRSQSQAAVDKLQHEAEKLAEVGMDQ